MAKKTTRRLRSYPTDVSDEEWEFCVVYLTLMTETAPQREHALRAIFNALRWMVRAGWPGGWRPQGSRAAPRRAHALRAIFNALRWMVRAGCPWRLLPNDLPPWTAVHQQTLRWIRAGCFEAMAHDLRMILRELAERASQPTAVIASASPRPPGCL